MKTKGFTGSIRNLKDKASSPSDIVLQSTRFFTERKQIDCTLSRNHIGEFVRITEQSKGRCNCIIIPREGLEKLENALSEIRKLSRQRPELSDR